MFGVKSKHKSGGGAVSWTAEDVQMYLATHGPGTMARLWFCLSYATHSRIGDAPTLGPGNEADHDGVRFIEWQPSKSGSAFVSIPMEDLLAQELKHHEERPTYLVTEHGRPFASPGSLDNRVRKWIIAAGLREAVVDDKGRPVLDDKGKPNFAPPAHSTGYGRASRQSWLRAAHRSSRSWQASGGRRRKRPRSTRRNFSVGAVLPRLLSGWLRLLLPRHRAQVDHGTELVVHIGTEAPVKQGKNRHSGSP